MKVSWVGIVLLALAAPTAIAGSVFDIDFENLAPGAAPVNQFVENRGAVKLDGYVARNPLTIASVPTQFGTRKVAQFTGNEVVALSLNKAYSTMTGVSLNRPRTATAATSSTGLGLAGDFTFECYFKIDEAQAGAAGYLFYNQYFYVLLNANGSLTIYFRDAAANAKTFTIGALPVWTAGSPGSWTSGYTYQAVAGNKRIFILRKPSETPVTPVNFLTGADSMFNRNTRAGDPTIVSYVCDGKWHHLAVTVNRAETVPGQSPTTGSTPPVGRFRVFWDGYDLTLYDELVNSNTMTAAGTKPQHSYRLNQWTKSATLWGDNGSSSWTMGTVGNPATDCFIGAQTATGTSSFKGTIDQIVVTDETLSPRNFRIPKALPVALPLTTPAAVGVKNYTSVTISGTTRSTTVSGTQPLGLLADFDANQNATVKYLSAWGYTPSATPGTLQGTLVAAGNLAFGGFVGTVYAMRSMVDTWQWAQVSGTTVNATNFVVVGAGGYASGLLAKAVSGFQPWWGRASDGVPQNPPNTGTGKYKVEASQGVAANANGTFVCGAPTIQEGPGGDPRVVSYNLTFAMPLNYSQSAGSVVGNVDAAGTLTRIRYPSAVVNAAPSAEAVNSFTANGQVQGGTVRQTECFVAVDTADKGTTAGLWAIVQGLGQADEASNPQSYAGTVAGLASGTTYYYRYFTVTPDGHETWATSAQTAVTTAAQAAPGASTAYAATDRTASSFSANWAANTAATTYFLDVATDSGFTSFVGGWQNVNVGNVFTLPVNSGLNPGGTYYFRVRAQNATGTGPDSNTITVVLPPAAPVASAATTVTASSFNANWAVSSGATAYFLDVATDSGFTSFVGGWQNVNVGNGITHSVNTGLIAGNTYYYRVRAQNSGGASTDSGTIAVTLPPPAPTASAASALTAGSFFANWAAANGAITYFLDVATDSGFTSYVSGWQNIDVNNVTTVSVNSSLAAGGVYYYRVRAENAGGVGANSSTITVALPPATPVATPATAVTASSFSANWAAASGATAYFLDVATDSGFTSYVSGWQNQSVANVTTYIVNTGLSAGGTYYYRVRAVSAGAVLSANSSTIPVTLTPPAPSGLQASDGTSTKIRVTWNDGNGETGYTVWRNTVNDSGTAVNLSGMLPANTTDYEDATVPAGPVYWYWVVASGSGGDSGFSAGDSGFAKPVTTVFQFAKR